MTSLIIVVQIVVALLLILFVLLQPGNKGGIGAALGGGGGGTVFGAKGANTFLSKLTLVAAILFMLTNITLSLISYSHSSAVDTVFSKKNAALTEKQEPKSEKAPVKKNEKEGE